MSKTTQKTEEERCMIIAYYKEGLTNIDIARKLGINEKTVSRWIHNYKENGNVKNIKKDPRPNAITDIEDKKICNYYSFQILVYK